MACWVNLDKNNTLNINYFFLITIYEMDIRTHFKSSYISQGLNELVSASPMKIFEAKIVNITYLQEICIVEQYTLIHCNCSY